MIAAVVYMSVAYACLETAMQFVRNSRQHWWSEYWLVITSIYVLATSVVLYVFWQQLQILASIPAFGTMAGIGLLFYGVYRLSQAISQPILLTDQLTLLVRVTRMIRPWWKDLIIRASGLLFANVTFLAILLTVIGYGISVLQVMSVFVGLLLIIFSILVWIWREALQVSWFISACIIPGVAYLVLFVPSGFSVLWGAQVLVYLLIHLTFELRTLEEGI